MCIRDRSNASAASVSGPPRSPSTPAAAAARVSPAAHTTTPGGRLVFHVFAALAEFIRELIVEGTREGLDAARARGTRLGRPPAMTPEQIRHARDLLTRPENTVASIARLLGVSRNTIYKYLPEISSARALPDADIPAQTAPAP